MNECLKVNQNHTTDTRMSNAGTQSSIFQKKTEFVIGERKGRMGERGRGYIQAKTFFMRNINIEEEVISI